MPTKTVALQSSVRHTAAMSSTHWRGPRLALAAVAGCVILAACGSSGGSHQSSVTPSASATLSAEPTSGAAAVAAITANWKTVFNGKAALPSRTALVQDGSQVSAFVEAQSKTSFGQAATGSTATVSAVALTSPALATVHYQVLLLGTPLLKNQVGTAVYEDGVWKVAIGSFCALAYLEFPKGSPQLPAACQS